MKLYPILITTFLLAPLSLSFAKGGNDGLGGPPAVQPPSSEPLASCGCTADGASCLFGVAGGCSIYCPPGINCSCSGGGCFLGFPQGSTCKCTNRFPAPFPNP